MSEERGQWAGYMPYLIAIMFIIAAACVALTAAVREATNSWMAYLISPAVGSVLLIFVLSNWNKLRNGHPTDRALRYGERRRPVLHGTRTDQGGGSAGAGNILFQERAPQ